MIEIDRPLTELEKSLLLYLGVRTVADQVRCSESDAADALDMIAAEGRAEYKADGANAFLICYDHVIVHATREWLAFMALAGQDDLSGPG